MASGGTAVFKLSTSISFSCRSCICYVSLHASLLFRIFEFKVSFCVTILCLMVVNTMLSYKLICYQNQKSFIYPRGEFSICYRQE